MTWSVHHDLLYRFTLHLLRKASAPKPIAKILLPLFSTALSDYQCQVLSSDANHSQATLLCLNLLSAGKAMNNGDRILSALNELHVLFSDESVPEIILKNHGLDVLQALLTSNYEEEVISNVTRLLIQFCKTESTRFSLWKCVH